MRRRDLIALVVFSMSPSRMAGFFLPNHIAGGHQNGPGEASRAPRPPTSGKVFSSELEGDKITFDWPAYVSLWEGPASSTRQVGHDLQQRLGPD